MNSKYQSIVMVTSIMIWIRLNALVNEVCACFDISGFGESFFPHVNKKNISHFVRTRSWIQDNKFLFGDF